MPLYTKQRDKYGCGPVAILNALKWADVDASYPDYIDYLKKLTSCVSPRGTRHAAFDRALREAGEGFYSVRRVYRPTLGEIEDHLRTSGTIVLNYCWRSKDQEHRHFVMLVGVSNTGQSLYTVNGFREGPALQRISRQRFKKRELQFQRADPSYKAWFLKKVE